jgi:hypothetical protein
VRSLGKALAIAAGLLIVGTLAIVLLVGPNGHGSGAGTTPSVTTEAPGSTTAVDQAIDRLDRLVKP